MSHQLKPISQEEDKIVTKAALADPDCPPLTDEQISKTKLRPFKDVHPQLFKTKKTPVSIRIDDDVLTWFKTKAAGGSYQAMINQTLRDKMAGESSDLEATLRRVIREELQHS
jgi:uncharacterized protein (DUF4415 family)